MNTELYTKPVKRDYTREGAIRARFEEDMLTGLGRKLLEETNIFRLMIRDLKREVESVHVGG